MTSDYSHVQFLANHIYCQLLTFDVPMLAASRIHNILLIFCFSSKLILYHGICCLFSNIRCNTGVIQLISPGSGFAVTTVSHNYRLGVIFMTGLKQTNRLVRMASILCCSRNVLVLWQSHYHYFFSNLLIQEFCQMIGKLPI